MDEAEDEVRNILVEDRDTTQGSTGPLSEILVKLGMYGLEEGPHNWDLESWPGDRALSLEIHDCETSTNVERHHGKHIKYLGHRQLHREG